MVNNLKQQDKQTRKQNNTSHNNNNGIKLETGQRISLPVKRLGINGEGIGYYQRQVVFINGALPGEEVQAEITEISSKHAVGHLIRIEKPSPHRQTEKCSLSARCGGCQLLHMSYRAQLVAKKELVIEAFQRYCGIKKPPVRNTAGMEEPWQYRNKAQFQVGREKGKIVAGLYSLSSRQLVNLSGCLVQSPEINKVVKTTTKILDELGIEPYNERKKTGVVRTLVVRHGFETGEMQLTLVTGSKALPKSELLVKRLCRELPELTGISQNINPGRAQLVFGRETVHLWGAEKIRERLGKLEFLLSPRAFFQLNPRQTVKLYEYGAEAAGLTGKEKVVDAYCGVGTIGLWLASKAKEVRGIEEIPEAVKDAAENAKRMGIKNAGFYTGRAETLLPQWVKEGYKPDVIVVDPPRTGLDKSLMDVVISVRAKRLVYVSCNPATLAKDCSYLLEKGYKLEWVQPVDMFPHTAHVECVCLLEKQ